MYEGQGLIQKLSMNCNFIYTCQKGQWPVQGRDFSLLTMSYEYPDGRIVLTRFSHEHPDYPPNKKYTRGEIINGGWILTPDPKNPNRTFAVLLSQVDPKGSLPKSIVNKAIKKRGFMVKKVAEVMEKHY